MDKSDKVNKNVTMNNVSTLEESTKQKNRCKKRKRQDSESSTDLEDILPENTLEVEKNLHASAIKNNLDDVSVKKILKKVVTNDHVLALVKLREEEESSRAEAGNLQPKITRSKAKELMRVSPKSAPWTLELTPIKHIPVKTRPEVEALISKDLPEDEDDDEYQPTHEDVQSDDEHTLESCSDAESQPRTPATPGGGGGGARGGGRAASPRVLRDGPFKVPQGATTPARRKLIIEEEATIALRTRSKLSLSATPIEHIESSFVPPDELPTLVGDEIWNKFLEECMNPAELSRNEDDDEADPEYNVATDPDAHDEDEEALDNTLIKISQKELNDLVTELFSILPESAAAEDLVDNLAKSVLTDNNATEISSQWEGKQEPLSDEDKDTDQTDKQAQKIACEKRDSATRFSIGKSEPEDPEDLENLIIIEASKEDNCKKDKEKTRTPNKRRTSKVVKISVEERAEAVLPSGAERVMPAPLRALEESVSQSTTTLQLSLDQPLKILPVQIQILQQQLRQHVQLAASNFIQLFVNPAHWKLAPAYKEYLEQFENMLESNPDSVVNVCNLKPALELVRSWESTVSEDTPENKKMVEYIQSEAERGRRHFHQNRLYAGEFPPLMMQVIANSAVFLYPYLLPAMPYRADNNRKFGYTRSEDELIALGMDQFWQYVEDNPKLFKKRNYTADPRHRWGLTQTLTLCCKHMFPWLTPKLLLNHVHWAKKEKDNPVYNYFKKCTIEPLKHKLLPFNPSMTLYEQPEHEVPRIWVRYLAKSSKRFMSHLYKRKHSGIPPNGVTIDNIAELQKSPMPINFFTHNDVRNRVFHDKPLQDKLDVEIAPLASIVRTVDPLSNTAKEILITVPKEQNEAVIQNTIINNTTEKAPPNEGTTTTNVIRGSIVSTASNVNTNSTPSTANVVNNDGKVVGNLIPLGKLMPVDQTPTIIVIPPVTNNSTEAKTSNEKDKTATPNVFSVLKTDQGVFLVPLTVLGPVNSDATTQNTPNTPKTILDEVMTRVEELKHHCQCCILLRKISKKQTRITDFFKRKDGERSCECTGRKYPRISKRLRLLVNNYRGQLVVTYKHLENTLKSLSKKNGMPKDKVSKVEEEYNLEDIACVAAYQMKLTTRSVLTRNIYTKKKINNVLSQFNPDVDDPVKLAEQMFTVLETELIDLYKEFIGFLTPEQADKISRFKDYFVHNCMKDLVDRVETEITDIDTKTSILDRCKKMYSDNVSTSCEICSNILLYLVRYPQLAHHVFSLFPHRAKDEPQKKDKDSTQTFSKISTQPATIPPAQDRPKTPDATIGLNHKSVICNEELDSEETEDRPEGNLTICDEVPMDYEADHSSCDEESEINRNEVETDRCITKNGLQEVKYESTAHNEFFETEITVSKTEVQEHSDSTNMSPLVMSDDEPVKSELPEWKREEDKLILEVLLQYLTPQERKDKTILEILEEKNVFEMIVDTSLPHKSLEDVKQRVMYLLEILVLSDY